MSVHSVPLNQMPKRYSTSWIETVMEGSGESTCLTSVHDSPSFSLLDVSFEDFCAGFDDYEKSVLVSSSSTASGLLSPGIRQKSFDSALVFASGKQQQQQSSSSSSASPVRWSLDQTAVTESSGYEETSLATEEDGEEEEEDEGEGIDSEEVVQSSSSSRHRMFGCTQDFILNSDPSEVRYHSMPATTTATRASMSPASLRSSSSSSHRFVCCLSHTLCSRDSMIQSTRTLEVCSIRETM